LLEVDRGGRRRGDAVGQQCQKRQIAVSKATYHSVKRDLSQCKSDLILRLIDAGGGAEVNRRRRRHLILRLIDAGGGAEILAS
jgi:hypothetical protein